MQLGDSPVVVRQKLHEASPMTIDQALYEMELVGHPFYLFIDSRNEAALRGLPPARVDLRRHPVGHGRRLRPASRAGSSRSRVS